jgi:chromosome segregation ATPase
MGRGTGTASHATEVSAARTVRRQDASSRPTQALIDTLNDAVAKISEQMKQVRSRRQHLADTIRQALAANPHLEAQIAKWISPAQENADTQLADIERWHAAFDSSDGPDMDMRQFGALQAKVRSAKNDLNSLRRHYSDLTRRVTRLRTHYRYLVATADDVQQELAPLQVSPVSETEYVLESFEAADQMTIRNVAAREHAEYVALHRRHSQWLDEIRSADPVDAVRRIVEERSFEQYHRVHLAAMRYQDALRQAIVRLLDRAFDDTFDRYDALTRRTPTKSRLREGRKLLLDAHSIRNPESDGWGLAPAEQLEQLRHVEQQISWLMR